MRRRAAASVVAVALALAACDLSPGGGEETAPAPGVTQRTYEIDSKLVGEVVRARVLIPDDAPVGLVVFLHSRGGSIDTYTDELAAALEHAKDPPAVVLVAGDESSYYHDRDAGRWGTYVIQEALPHALAEVGLDDDTPVVIAGISMGGFGALDLARLHPLTFCAAAGHSPAVFGSAGETAAGAFDDAEDFAAHDLIAAARRGEFASQRIWIDIGAEDPFLPGVRLLDPPIERASTSYEYREWPGGHDSEYWDSHFDEYMKFYTRAIAACTT